MTTNQKSKPLNEEISYREEWVAWCNCGDSLTRCDVSGTEANLLAQAVDMSEENKGRTFYCFGCNQLYRLQKVTE